MAFSPFSSRPSSTASIGGLEVPQANFSRRRLRLFLIWGFISLICGFLDWSGIRGVGFSTFDAYFYEMKVKASARFNADLGEKARKEIVIVPITDNTFSPDNPDQLHQGPPVSRQAYAAALRSLKKAGARSVVFDVVFKVPHGDKVDEDFVKAAKEPGAPAVWACLVENEEVEPRLVQPFTQLREASSHQGHILSPQEGGDGGVRRIQTVYKLGNQYVPALCVAAVLASEKDSAPITRTATGWRIGSLSLPEVFNIQYLSDANGDGGVRYLNNTSTGNDIGVDSDGTQSSISTVPFEWVVRGVAQNNSFYRQFFKDKIVIIGDETKLSNDFRNTPVGVLPGVEIQANAIASVLMAQSGSHPLAWDIPPVIAFAILSLLSALTLLTTARLAPMRGALGIMALACAYFLFEAGAFIVYGLNLHTAGPTVAIIFTALFVFLERGVWEEREKMYVRGLLGRYVSPSVADYILRHPERCALGDRGGEEITATVLFADIRGFTALTEHFPPRVTLELLNDYFQAMSDVVFAHDGMVDKFMGDAIMAIFGAPVATSDHPTRALNAAVQMLERIDELQVHWQEKGLPLIRIGIGIGTGTMIIGNMGSETRADFSVVGDAVNLAARLQDMNKELGTTILVSSATRTQCNEKALPQGVNFGEVHLVHVRGHAREDEIFPVHVETMRATEKADVCQG